MRDFFRGWRRKLGCVTLLLACVFTAAWLRHAFVTDHLDYSVGPDVADSWISADNCLFWIRNRIDRKKYSRYHPKEMMPALDPPYYVWSTSPSGKLDLRSYEWYWYSFGIGFGQHEREPGIYWSYAITPFWIMITPLTSISALLLISPSKRHWSNRPSLD